VSAVSLSQYPNLSSFLPVLFGDIGAEFKGSINYIESLNSAPISPKRTGGKEDKFGC
jgi:hypothetical protein